MVLKLNRSESLYHKKINASQVTDLAKNEKESMWNMKAPYNIYI